MVFHTLKYCTALDRAHSHLAIGSSIAITMKEMVYKFAIVE